MRGTQTLDVAGAESWNGNMGWKRARKLNKYEIMQGFEDSDNCTYIYVAHDYICSLKILLQLQCR